MTTGEKVRAYRMRAKASQDDLAQKIGITSVSFGMKERGECPWKVTEVVTLAKELGVDIHELIGE